MEPRPAIGLRVLGAVALIAAAIVVDACAHHDGKSKQAQPAHLSAFEAHSDHGMVSTGSAEATRAGVQILELGGNAVDAAVAAAFALGVADPGGSGLGGMTYILISPANGPAVAVDGSARVPLAAEAAALLAALDTPGARQMLAYHHTDPPGGTGEADPLRIQLLADLTAVGEYPAGTRKVAIANGSATRMGQGFSPGEQIIEWEYSSLLVDIIGMPK